MYNILTLIFVWVIVAFCTLLAYRSDSNLPTSIALLYTLYFALLAMVASWRNPDVWHSQVAKFDWSVTSSDYIDPRSLKRPGNPQMEKFSEKSTPTHPSFESNFRNPFSNGPIDDFAPQFAIVHPPRPRGQALDRHQVMNRYTNEPEIPASQSMSMSTQGFGSLTISSHGTTFEGFDARQLAAMKLDGKAPEQARIGKNKPQLSVWIPPPPQSTTRISTGGGARPKSQVDHEREHMPFQGSFSSEGGHSTTPERSSVPNIPPLHMSFLNQGMSPLYKSPLDEPENLALQSVLAPHRYPDIVQSPNRKSTAIIPGSIPRTLTPAAPSGAVLPMHSGDLPVSRPRRVPVPRDFTLPTPQTRTPTTPEMRQGQGQVRRSQTERRSRMHGPRSVSGPAHNRSSSNQTWPPHAKQSRHVPTRSDGSIPSDSTSTGPRGPWCPPGLSSLPNSQHRPKSVRMPPRGWHYPSSSTEWAPSAIPSLSSSASTNHTRYPSIPPPVVSESSRIIAGTEAQAFGTPTNSDHLPSSFESTQATWKELDEQFRLKYGMDDKRSSRGKLRKPNPRVFNDTL